MNKKQLQYQLQPETQNNSTFKDMDQFTTNRSIDQFRFNTQDFIAQNFDSFESKYRVDKNILGEGGYGQVKKVIHKKTGLTRVVKIISKQFLTPEKVKKLQNEFNILKELDHPNILKVYEYFEDQNQFYIITEFCQGGELYEKISNNHIFSEQKAAKIIKQLIQGVHYLHQRNTIHLDLKPENLLFDSNEEDSLVKIIDFGISRKLGNNHKDSYQFGTTYYMAPENFSNSYNKKSDIWSCGVILYLMLIGKLPFYDENEEALEHKILDGNFCQQSLQWMNLSSEAKSLINIMLERDIYRRANTSQCLNHKWIILNGQPQNKSQDKQIIDKVLKNMKSFKIEEKLLSGVWMYIASQLSSKKENQEVQKIFNLFDKDGDGVINKEELKLAFQNFNKDNIDVESIFQSIDQDQNGGIEISEFLMAAISRDEILSKQRIEVFFQIFDKDQNGRVNIEEFKQILDKNQRIDKEIWQELIREVDENKDGEISFEEFAKMMNKLHNDQSTKNQKNLLQNQSL